MSEETDISGPGPFTLVTVVAHSDPHHPVTVIVIDWRCGGGG